MPWEVVLVDNGSADASVDVASSFADRLPSLRVVTELRRGRHYACDRGVQEAQGDVVVFVDADDEVAPGYLDAMASALRRSPVVAATGDWSALNPDWSESFGSSPTGLRAGFGFLPFADGGRLGFQRSAYLSLGGFAVDMAYCEDVDLCWRAQLAGLDITVAPGAVLRYRQRASTRRMFVQHWRFGRARALLYREYRAHGMPRRTVRSVVREWTRIVRTVPFLRNRTVRARWARRVGRSIGFVWGSIRYRVLYL